MAREKTASETAFAKACRYLDFSSNAKWLAHLSGAAAGLILVGLLGHLWLYIDYLDWHGRVPRFNELSHTQKQRVRQMWFGTPKDRRLELLESARFSDAEARRLAADDAVLEAADAQRLWAEMVWRLLDDRYGKEAVEAVFHQSENTPSGWAMTSEDRGILSLAVRSELRTLPSAVPFLANWNRWMWNRGAGEGISLFPPYLAGMALGTVILGLLGTFLVILNREMAARAATEASSRIRRAVYHQSFRLGTLALRAMGPSEAVTLLTRHTEALHDAFYARLTSWFREPLVMGLLVLFAFFADLQLALAFILFVLVVYGVGTRLVAYFRDQSKKAGGVAAERLTVIRESLMLMRLVKVYMMEQFNQARIERQLSRYGSVQRLRHRADALAFPLLALLAGGCVLVLLYVGALMALYGGLSLAGGVVLAASMLLLYRPLERWLEAARLTRRAKESAAQVFDFLDRKGDVPQVVGAEFLPPLAKQLEFDSVTLRDPGTGRTLLDGVSLTIPAGERVGVVGLDDLEKHALAYLVPRLLDPTSGEIRLDGKNLRWVTLDSLRAQIGVVMSHNLVFHDTIKNNIGCGDPAYTGPQIIEAAKMAHAHKFIQGLPQGYETQIGEQGHSLTLSQQYRIALARAILRDPALLIIEEPDAELDEETKSLLDDTLARALPERTAIFLPHRISTLKSCSTIHLLSKGKVVASGTHKELLGASKLYKHIHYLEFNQFDEA
ncbi:MAG: ABC transporter ATP-binding protein/permease [Gemmataceae bacterium]|nr:ABC transporter ATP-binding protein/permease [Gemmataceae bacterium]